MSERYIVDLDSGVDKVLKMIMLPPTITAERIW